MTGFTPNSTMSALISHNLPLTTVRSTTPTTMLGKEQRDFNWGQASTWQSMTIRFCALNYILVEMEHVWNRRTRQLYTKWPMTYYNPLLEGCSCVRQSHLSSLDPLLSLVWPSLSKDQLQSHYEVTWGDLARESPSWTDTSSNVVRRHWPWASINAFWLWASYG